MKRQVLTYTRPANELKKGDLVLTRRMTVGEVRTVEAFDDSTGRPCVAVTIGDGAMHYLADDLVLVLE